MVWKTMSNVIFPDFPQESPLSYICGFLWPALVFDVFTVILVFAAEVQTWWNQMLGSIVRLLEWSAYPHVTIRNNWEVWLTLLLIWKGGWKAGVGSQVWSKWKVNGRMYTLLFSLTTVAMRKISLFKTI